MILCALCRKFTKHHLTDSYLINTKDPHRALAEVLFLRHDLRDEVDAGLAALDWVDVSDVLPSNPKITGPMPTENT